VTSRRQPIEPRALADRYQYDTAAYAPRRISFTRKARAAPERTDSESSWSDRHNERYQAVLTQLRLNDYTALYPRRHNRRLGQGVQSRLSVCLSVCPRSKRKMALAINTKLGTRILYSSRSACIDPQVKRSKVTVTRLRKPSRRTVASDYSRHPVTLYCATCGRCRHGSACRYDCLFFSYKCVHLLTNLLTHSLDILTRVLQVPDGRPWRCLRICSWWQEP